MLRENFTPIFFWHTMFNSQEIEMNRYTETEKPTNTLYIFNETLFFQKE